MVDDCVYRALSVALDLPWDIVAIRLTVYVLLYHDRPDSNLVWGKMLEDYGFKRRSLPDTCPSCYTVRDFVADHPTGIYILATGSHVIAVINGTYFDTIDTGDYVPAYYWEKIM